MALSHTFIAGITEGRDRLYGAAVGAVSGEGNLTAAAVAVIGVAGCGSLGGHRSKQPAAAQPVIGVNGFLWRATLDTLAFMPLASADPYGGTVITDWYTNPEKPDERFKATVYILSRDLRSDGVRVNIYRQVLQNGQWVDATVADSTVGDIENKVLARARRMREQLQTSS